METIDTITGMQKRSEELRLSGKTIALVPTMGFFHEGHLELMRVGRHLADKLIVSIFVNPTQFGPSEDFEEYPRDMEGDLEKAREVGVDLAFIPAAEEMYPDGFQTNVTVEGISKYLCGISRPHFFGGIATIVTKLFNITKPHLSIFGEKDFQQLAVIHRMVKDLDMGIEIVGVPTVREPDGLAMSSRNSCLSSEERRSALSLKKSIDMANDMVGGGEKDAAGIISAIQALISSHLFTKIDYISICDPITMEDKATIEGECLLALAVKIGKTRLIDNCLIDID
ncbi:MAG: pantoate--beta-alanine ligase [Deltaproteobacteria bacterium]|nr:pantoate--beta-alanine ligase [Deltaproteobacteria bacterium]